MTAPDPDKLTREAGKRCEALLREMRRRYPDALAAMQACAEEKGRRLPDWPDWCWVPMAGASLVVRGGGTLTPDDPWTADVARVAALSTWRLTKGIYWVEDDIAGRHVDAVWASPGVPAERPMPRRQLIDGLPQHCVYICWPPVDRPVLVTEGMLLPLGVFVHLEHDAATGRPELRLLVDTDGTWGGLVPMPVLLDRPTLLASARELAGGVVADAGDEVREALAEFGRLLPFLVWPVVLAVTDPEAQIQHWDRPGESPQRARPRVRGGIARWRGAEEVTRWRVTDRPRGGRS